MPGNTATTKSLINFNADFTDEAVGAVDVHTPVLSFSPTIDTVIKQFGAGSGKFGGSSWVSYADSADYNLSNNEFAIEVFVSRSSADTQMGIIAQVQAFGLYMTGSVVTAKIEGGGGTITLSGGTLLLDILQHIVIYRLVDTFYLAIDSVIVDSSVNVGYTVTNSAQDFTVGRHPALATFRNLRGNIDSLRITIGDAVGDATGFPVPTEEYDAFTAPVNLTVLRTFDDTGVKYPFGDRFYARDAGIALSEFTATVTLDDASNSLPVAISEISGGYYEITFSPNADGHWQVWVTRSNGEKWWLDVSTLPWASNMSYPPVTKQNVYSLDTKSRRVSYSQNVEVNEITKALVLMTTAIDYRVVVSPMSKNARISVKRGVSSFEVYSDRQVIVECLVLDTDKLNKNTENIVQNTSKSVISGMDPDGSVVVKNIPDEAMKPLVFAGANEDK